jgi:hypothetical protein
MMTQAFFPLLIAALAAAGSASEPGSREAPFTLVMPVSPESRDGQDRIWAKAQEVCGEWFPVLGQYRFEGTERLSGGTTSDPSFTVHQQLVCSEVPIVRVFDTPADPAWQPSAGDEAQVRDLMIRYFALVDSGDAAAAHAHWSAANQEMTSLSERSRAIAEFRRTAGTPETHRIWKLSWYVNPEGAPEPGIYVAADYERKYSNLGFNCGYLAWLRQADGSYRIVREETTLVTSADAAKLPPQDLAAMRTASRCPGD